MSRPYSAASNGDARRHFRQVERLVQTQPNIFGHAKGVKQAEVLKHHADAQGSGLLRVSNLDGLAVVMGFRPHLA